MPNRNILALTARLTLAIEGAPRVAPAVATTDKPAQEQDAPLGWFKDVLGRWRFRAPRGAA